MMDYEDSLRQAEALLAIGDLKAAQELASSIINAVVARETCSDATSSAPASTHLLTALILAASAAESAQDYIRSAHYYSVAGRISSSADLWAKAARVNARSQEWHATRSTIRWRLDHAIRLALENDDQAALRGLLEERLTIGESLPEVTKGTHERMLERAREALAQGEPKRAFAEAEAVRAEEPSVPRFIAAHALGLQAEALYDLGQTFRGCIFLAEAAQWADDPEAFFRAANFIRKEEGLEVEGLAHDWYQRALRLTLELGEEKTADKLRAKLAQTSPVSDAELLHSAELRLEHGSPEEAEALGRALMIRGTSNREGLLLRARALNLTNEPLQSAIYAHAAEKATG